MVKKTKEALKTFDKAIELDPKNAYMWARRGVALLKLNKVNEAFKAFNRAIKINPADVHIREAKRLALLWLKKLKKP